MIIGYRLKEAREKKGLTQKQVGALLGTSGASICGYEKNTKTPTMSNFFKLVDILSLDIAYTLGVEIEVIPYDNDKEKFKISQKDIDIIDYLKNNPELYNKLYMDMKRTFHKMEKNLRNTKI